MSLVAYDSSDDSDRDEPQSRAPATGSSRGLFASLPAPKNSSSGQTLAPQPKRTGLDLPKPKKRSEPVKITVPVIKPADSDSDEDEPVRKKPASQPKNLVVKEAQRPLVPHSLTKRPDQAKTTASKSLRAPGSTPSSSPSPSAIKAAAKSAALQLARQMAADEDGSDDELAPENYFSLPESSMTAQVVDSQQFVPSLPPPVAPQDAPLEFGSNAESSEYLQSLTQNLQHPENALEQASPQEYYGEEYYQEPNPEEDDQEGSGSSSFFNDEAFRRIQGKQNRGREEIKFLEIKGDDQLSGNKQWLTKNMTAETEQQRSFSKKRDHQPTGQQRRKHQITYLIHQAKARELELKNSWAENKLSRRQTQAKYGF
ncbi:hypothetical protein DNTS_032048 [Danionella cerebrum]|uniref:Proline-rich protein PRCC n=1 Tax=Danionella cerebrum TaxID=2873325 RepID=A0A553P9K0_9TELE|nr:hypothetical protein DNTS_032048 [Danionella translucida]